MRADDTNQLHMRAQPTTPACSPAFILMSADHTNPSHTDDTRQIQLVGCALIHMRADDTRHQTPHLVGPPSST